jgi:hypothetical protein
MSSDKLAIYWAKEPHWAAARKTKGGNITVPLTSCLIWNQLYDS